MRYTLRWTCALISLSISICLIASARAGADQLWAADFSAFSALEPIDSHAHAFQADKDFYSFLTRLHLHLVDIAVATGDKSYPTLDAKISALKTFVKESGGRAVLATTFDPFRYGQADFAEGAIRQLNRDFADGAIAVKIWKNVGMELKDASGRFVLPDDARLQPIYQDIAAHGKTLIAHLAEPDSCWQPPNPNSPDYNYYREHPEWYMYRHPDHPSKAAILQARDHVLALNPKLRVVGAHLGSMEMDLDGLAERFDRYPNFAVDVAARVAYLAIQPRDKVRQFLIKYQDRILYATDLELEEHSDEPKAAQEWEKRYANDWRLFSSDQAFSYARHPTKGLALPPAVLRKLYHDNAVRWMPGVISQ